MTRTSVIAVFSICLSLFFAASSPADQSGQRPVQAAVLEYIEANMPWPPRTARVEFLSGESDAKPPIKHTVLRIEPMGMGDFIGDAAFMVRHLDNGSLLRTETVRTRIEVLRDHVIAARTLAPGTILTEADLRTVRKWDRRINLQALTAKEEAIGKRLSSQTRAGMEISNFMLKDVPLVRKGKIVKVIFDNGPMRIVTVGIPEEDGIAGAIVRVRNATSNKIMYVRVLGDSLVGIEI